MKPLKGKTVLITRDASQAGSLKQQLEEKGANVITVPTISIKDPPDWQSFDQAASELENFDWIVFSSINAVVQTEKRLRHNKISIESLKLPRIAAAGDQTARSLQDIGWKVELVPNRFQADDLGTRLVDEGVGGKRIWLPRALKARKVLIDILVRAGAEVLMTPVYQNVVPLENRERLRAALRQDQPDWITFTSSSTVDNFFKILDWDPSNLKLPKLASIGMITTETMDKYAIKPAFTADPQNLEGLCNGIVQWEAAQSYDGL